MSDGFWVDLGALDGAVQGSAAVAGQVEQAGAMTVPPQAAVGHDGLAEALATFGSATSTGIEHLVADARRFHSGLVQSRATYESQEQAVCRAMTGSVP